MPDSKLQESRQGGSVPAEPPIAHAGQKFAGRVAALCLLVLALAYGIAATRIEYAFSSDPLGPQAFPVLLAGALALLSAIYLIVPGKSAAWPQGALRHRSIALLALLFASALLLEPLGFAPAMFVLTGGVARVFGATWRASMIGGAVQAALWYLVFGYLLEVYLPAGYLLKH
jgi:putative tricarboxylic transport membrane protein